MEEQSIAPVFPFEVWSSGLETWEPVGLSFNEVMKTMDVQHIKNVAGEPYLVWHCFATNRWFRQRTAEFYKRAIIVTPPQEQQ